MPGSDSQALPICPLPSDWWKVEMTVPSAGLLFDSIEIADSFVDAASGKSRKVCPVNKVVSGRKWIFVRNFSLPNFSPLLFG